MPSGHDVPKPRTESSEPWQTRRQVGRDRFVTTAGTHSGFSAALDARDRDYDEAAALAPRTGPGGYTGTGMVSRRPDYEEHAPGFWRKKGD